MYLLRSSVAPASRSRNCATSSNGQIWRRFASFVHHPAQPNLADLRRPVEFRCFDQSFSNTLAVKEGVFWVDRTGYIRRLEDVQRSSPVVRICRPFGFGKTLFVDTLQQYYDAANSKDALENAFGHLDIGMRPTPLVGSFAVLRVDLAAAAGATSLDRCRAALSAQLNASCRQFAERYNVSLECDDSNGIVTFQRAMRQAHRGGLKVLVLVDEYDGVVQAVLRDLHFAKTLLVLSTPAEIADDQEARMLRENLYRAEQMLEEFLSAVNDALRADPGSRVLITGTTPFALSGSNALTDLTGDKAFAGLFGFTGNEVRAALAALAARESQLTLRMDELLEYLRDSAGGYRFRPRTAEVVFNPSRTLISLRGLPLHYNREGFFFSWRKRRAAVQMIDVTAEVALELVARTKLCEQVFRLDRLGEPFDISLAGGWLPALQLSQLCDIRLDDSALLSFLLHQGALTFGPRTKDGGGKGAEPILLCPPNDTLLHQFHYAAASHRHELSPTEHWQLLQILSTLGETGDTASLRACLIDRLRNEPIDRHDCDWDMYTPFGFQSQLEDLLVGKHHWAYSYLNSRLYFDFNLDDDGPNEHIAVYRNVPKEATGYRLYPRVSVQPKPCPPDWKPSPFGAPTTFVFILDEVLSSELMLAKNHFRSWHAAEHAPTKDVMDAVVRPVAAMTMEEVGRLGVRSQRTCRRLKQTVSDVAAAAADDFKRRYDWKLRSDPRFGSVRGVVWVRVAAHTIYETVVEF